MKTTSILLTTTALLTLGLTAASSAEIPLRLGDIVFFHTKGDQK